MSHHIISFFCILFAVIIATWHKWPLLFEPPYIRPSLVDLDEGWQPPSALAKKKKHKPFVLLELQPGDTLYRALQKKKIDHQQVYRLVNSLKKYVNPHHIRPNTYMCFTSQPIPHSRKYDLMTFRIRVDMTTVIDVSRHQKGFVAVKKTMSFVSKDHAVAGVVDYSLYAEARARKIPDTIIKQMIRALSHGVDFQRNIHPGSRFGVYYTTFMNPDTKEREPGDLHFAYVSIRDKDYKIYRFVHKDGSVYFYNDKAQNVRKTLLKTPVDGARLSSRFGMRHHPVLGYSKMHKGVDFAAPQGTPVMAAGDGKIIKAQSVSGYGNYIRIRHNQEYETAYAHLSRYGRNMTVGKWVQQGQMIGYVGKTGLASAPHLHYEVLQRGKQINPAHMTQLVAQNLRGVELDQFKKNQIKIHAFFKRPLHNSFFRPD